MFLVSVLCWFLWRKLFLLLTFNSLLVKLKNCLFCVWIFWFEELFLVCGCKLSLWLLSLCAIVEAHTHFVSFSARNKGTDYMSFRRSDRKYLFLIVPAARKVHFTRLVHQKISMTHRCFTSEVARHTSEGLGLSHSSQTDILVFFAFLFMFFCCHHHHLPEAQLV